MESKNTKPFKNKPNPVHKIGDKTIWESRSVAIVGIILAKFKNKTYVLIEKRSDTMMDAPGRWCLPCGYLDYNENSWEACVREVHEETGLFITDYNLINENYEQPFFVNSEPTENRQNVVLYHYCVLNYWELPEVESYQNSEIAKVKWESVKSLDEYDFAFNHRKRIDQALDSYHNYQKFL